MQASLRNPVLGHRSALPPPPVGKMANILGFVDHMVFVVTSQLCSCSMKSDTDTTEMGGYLLSSKDIYL